MDSTTTTPVSTLPPALTTSSAPPTPQNTAQQEQSQFLQLLVAQLQGQNPLDPKDGTEFVTQLAQFSSLEELINIRTTLQSLLGTSSSSSSTTTPAASTSTTSTTPA